MDKLYIKKSKKLYIYFSNTELKLIDPYNECNIHSFYDKIVDVLYIILLTFPPNSAILSIFVPLESYAGLNSAWLHNANL